MAKTFRRRPNDDEYDDENFETTPSGVRILRDGGRARRVNFLDATDARASHRLHDGCGSVPGRRPGFAFNRDEYARDEAEIAHYEYRHYLQNAWRDGNRSTVADAEGTDGDSGVSAGDASPQERAYQIYDAELRNMWRRPPR